MLRTTGLASAWLAVVCAACIAIGQEPAKDRNPLRIDPLRVLEEYGPDARIKLPRNSSPSAAPGEQHSPAERRVRDSVNGRTRVAQQPATTRDNSLSAFGADRPYDYSSNRRYLVAAYRDGGLALWDTTQREPLRHLENSNQRYSQVTISDDARWIAGVREDDGERIDLWRADNGRHVRWIRTASGPTSKLEFKNGNELHVTLADKNGLVFSVPAGVVVGRVQVGSGKAAVKRPTATFKFEPPQVVAPSTTRSFRSTKPPVAAGSQKQFHAEPVAPSAPAAESLATQAPSAQMVTPQQEAATRIAKKTAPPAATTAAPTAVPFEPPLPAAPSAAMPSFESVEPKAAAPSFEAVAPSEPAAAPSIAPADVVPSIPAEAEGVTEPSVPAPAPAETTFEPATAAPDAANADLVPTSDEGAAPSEIETRQPSACAARVSLRNARRRGR